MKNSVLLFLFLLPAACVVAQLKPVDKDSKIEFKIRNFGFGVSGTLAGLDGSIVFNPANPEASSFDISVKASSINTDNDMRDNHLVNQEYFDVKNYPLIRFVSESVKKSRKEGTYLLTGKLTIKNHTKEISFPFTATASGKGYLFTGSFKMDRREFDIGGASTISDNLEVLLSVVAE